ncbi:MAG: hypothetical protein SangKO_086800 [Sandaracinaceae bacterium]
MAIDGRNSESEARVRAAAENMARAAMAYGTVRSVAEAEALVSERRNTNRADAVEMASAAMDLATAEGIATYPQVLRATLEQLGTLRGQWETVRHKVTPPTGPLLTESLDALLETLRAAISVADTSTRFQVEPKELAAVNHASELLIGAINALGARVPAEVAECLARHSLDASKAARALTSARLRV